MAVVCREAGHADGDAKEATLNWPSGLAYDTGTEQLWIADRASSCIRQLSRHRTALDGRRSLWRKRLSSDPFAAPVGLALDPAAPEGAGELFVADTGNNLIRALPLNSTQNTPAGE